MTETKNNYRKALDHFLANSRPDELLLPLEFRFSVIEEDHRDYFAFLDDKARRNKATPAIGITAGIVLSGLLITGFFLHFLTWVLIGIGTLSLLLIAVVLIGKLAKRKAVKGSAELYTSEFTIRLEDDRFSIQFNNPAMKINMEAGYPKLHRIWEGNSAYYLYTSTKTVTLLPKRAIPSHFLLPLREFLRGKLQKKFRVCC